MSSIAPADAADRWTVNEPPRRGLPRLKADDFWVHRELIYFLAQRDLKVRYKQAFLGVAWAVIQPLVGAAFFYALFHRLVKIELPTGSYFAFAILGAGTWSYFSSAVHAGTNSLLNHVNLTTKVPFPRIVAPTAALLPGLVDLTVAASLALAVAGFAGDVPAVGELVIGVPAGLALLVLAAAGPAWLLSATVVQYRDVVALTTFALQFLQFASPVAYPPEFLPEPWRTLVYLNPVSGAVGMLRWALVGTVRPPLTSLLISVGVACVLAVVGLLHFRRRERSFADVI